MLKAIGHRHSGTGTTPTRMIDVVWKSNDLLTAPSASVKRNIKLPDDSHNLLTL